MEFKNFVSLIQKELTNDNDVMGKVFSNFGIQLNDALLGVSILVIVFLVFVLFYITSGFSFLPSDKRIDQYQRKYLMKGMDQFGAKSLDLNGKYNFFFFDITRITN